MNFWNGLNNVTHGKINIQFVYLNMKILTGAISSYLLIDKLSSHSKENDIFVSDAGGTYYATSQGYSIN